MSLRTDVDGLATRFAACRIPHEEWTHQAHLAVGMWHVDRYGADEALTRLRVGIRRLNDSHGAPNSTTLDSSVAGKDALLRFYSRERLMSAQARAAWVEPDILPLRVADLLRSNVER